jgi:HEAT repeat protein
VRVTEQSLIFLCAVFTVAGTAAEITPGAEELYALVQEAGRPEVFYGKPEQRDSLIAVLAGKSEEDPESLVGLLDTHWVLHFEVVRQALEKLGEPAAQALRIKLSEGGAGLPVAGLMAAFEKLGKPGDEKYLNAEQLAQNNGLKVSAARCLSAFGSGERAINMLLPWFGHSSARVRLAAVWAAGIVWKRDRKEDMKDTLINKIRLLCNDRHPLVRFTAAETLGIISSEAKNIPVPLTREN